MDKADHIATLIELKVISLISQLKGFSSSFFRFTQAEIEEHTGNPLRLVISGASEAHILASELGHAGIGVIQRAHQYPGSWDAMRTLPGPPLVARSAINVLMDANVTVGLEITEGWEARNTRFDLGWVSVTRYARWIAS